MHLTMNILVACSDFQYIYIYLKYFAVYIVCTSTYTYIGCYLPSTKTKSNKEKPLVFAKKSSI